MYKLTHRIYNEFKLIGFQLTDNDGNISSKKISEVIELIKQEQIEGFKVLQDESGADCIVGTNFQISELSISTLHGNVTLKSRILDDNGKVSGYIVETSDTHKELKISKEKMWEFAFSGVISGVKAGLVSDSEDGEEKRVLIVE